MNRPLAISILTTAAAFDQSPNESGGGGGCAGSTEADSAKLKTPQAADEVDADSALNTAFYEIGKARTDLVKALGGEIEGLQDVNLPEPDGRVFGAVIQCATSSSEFNAYRTAGAGAREELEIWLRGLDYDFNGFNNTSKRKVGQNGALVCVKSTARNIHRVQNRR